MEEKFQKMKKIIYKICFELIIVRYINIQKIQLIDIFLIPYTQLQWQSKKADLSVFF